MDIDTWMTGYERAWGSNAESDIRALFTPDAEYRADPWTAPQVGPDAIVRFWLDRGDEPDTWDFSWSLLGRSGDTFFVQGETRYARGTTYSNLWVVRLADDGRASAYTEWWMDQSSPS